ncbi:hypothetical protein D3C74_348290 [compost metagenome]
MLQLWRQVPDIYGFRSKMTGIHYRLSKVWRFNTAFGKMPAVHRTFGQVLAAYGGIRQMVALHGTSL